MAEHKSKERLLREWLPGWLADKAIANMDHNRRVTWSKTPQDALRSAFQWGASPEGHDFWQNVHAGKFPPDPKETKDSQFQAYLMARQELTQ